jgi:hypothetical protein
MIAFNMEHSVFWASKLFPRNFFNLILYQLVN